MAYVVDKVGEMPDFVKPPGSVRQSQSPPPNGNGSSVPGWDPSSTSAPTVGEETPELGSPTPITVTRVKKKKRTVEGGKKKRTATGDSGAAS